MSVNPRLFLLESSHIYQKIIFMLSIPLIISLLIIFLICLFWFYGMRAKELALLFAKAECDKRQLQLLDDTIALVKTRWPNKFAFMKIERIYEFEYASALGERFEARLIIERGIVTVISFNKPTNKVDQTPNAQGNVIQFPGSKH